jgi:hypothetical protein
MPEENGRTAVKYYTTIPHVVTVQKAEYLFTVRANICLAWILNEHVDIVLGLHRRGKCCGGSQQQEYRLANESDVRRWTNNGGGD